MVLKLLNSHRPDSQLESQWALLKLQRNRQLIVSSLYRPPRHSVAALQADFANPEFQLKRILIEQPKVPFVIRGDLNCEILKNPHFPARRHIDVLQTDYTGLPESIHDRTNLHFRPSLGCM